MTNIPAGKWVIDPSHSEVSFWVSHLMISKVRGSFTSFSGHIITGEKPEDTRISGAIEVASITTRDEGRDAHLKSADFFDAEHFPLINFHSTEVVSWKRDRFIVKGEITIKDVTRPIELEVEFGGIVKDPFGNTKAVASATGKIRRSDFGLNWNAALETGGVLVGEDINLSLEAQAVLQIED